MIVILHCASRLTGSGLRSRMSRQERRLAEAGFVEWPGGLSVGKDTRLRHELERIEGLGSRRGPLPSLTLCPIQTARRRKAAEDGACPATAPRQAPRKMSLVSLFVARFLRVASRESFGHLNRISHLLKASAWVCYVRQRGRVVERTRTSNRTTSAGRLYAFAGRNGGGGQGWATESPEGSHQLGSL